MVSGPEPQTGDAEDDQRHRQPVRRAGEGGAEREGLGAVRSEPLRDSAHRSVIEVHLAEGNHAEALRQYDGYRRLLADELGLPPSPAIRRLVAPLLGRPVDLPRAAAGPRD